MEGLKRQLRQVPQAVPLHTLRGMYHQRVSSKAGDNRAELTAEQTRETEAVLADLKRERDDAFLRWPVEE